MGCGGKKVDPTEYIPPPPEYKQAPDIFEEAIRFAQEEYPEAYGAREAALKDVVSPEFYEQFGARVTPEYFQQFGPTSFEEALADSAYKRMARGIKGGLSLSGMERSPELARELGAAGLSLDDYLAQLGQRRAELGLSYGGQQALNALSSRLGIDPYNVTGPYANVDLGQSNLQANANYQTELLKANAEYLKAQAKVQEKQAKISSITSIVGGGIGFAVGGPAGAAIGASVGGTAGTLFGGGQPPIDMGQALAIANLPKTAQVSGTSGTGVGGFNLGSAQVMGQAQPVNAFPRAPRNYTPPTFGYGG